MAATITGFAFHREQSGNTQARSHRFMLRSPNRRQKKGSSRIAGKDALDLHEKEFAIPVTVRHLLNDLYSIVYSFQLTGVHRPANPAHDAPPVTL
jgi:hypothetical protein